MFSIMMPRFNWQFYFLMVHEIMVCLKINGFLRFSGMQYLNIYSYIYKVQNQQISKNLIKPLSSCSMELTRTWQRPNIFTQNQSQREALTLALIMTSTSPFLELFFGKRLILVHLLNGCFYSHFLFPPCKQSAGILLWRRCLTRLTSGSLGYNTILLLYF